jgi:hypothetical protein
MDDHPAQISIAALAYPQQLRFASRRIFSRDKT